MVQQSPNSGSLAEVLDRILDKGLVVDAWARISLVGIEILTIEARGLFLRTPDAGDGHDIVRAYTGGFDVKSDGSRPTLISHKLR